ncbi:hypothetical protein GTV32_20660 [Gordonia sp. SID5947]|uniref:hypothetical protein n=1 Tax=Gordonia sp. SID5947 TaxID=2690315 RepID=UPI00136F66F7|nr:hypothetical protein [Gordonia sp. SID5947]MYR08570.1 hypothetical protein [Gordonia sp. SID5947]
MDLHADAFGFVHRAKAVFVDDSELRGAVADNVLDRVWRGTYRATDAAPSDRDEQYRERVFAASLGGGDERVLSHSSAAAVHRLPLLEPDHQLVHFVTTSGGRETPTVFLHRDRRLQPSDIEIIDGRRVTTLGRTAADVARMGSFDQAVCALDAALALGVGRDVLDQHAARARRQHGAATLRRALAVADGRAESVAESYSRAVILTFPDIPEPEIQHVIHDECGRFVARVDFLIAGCVVGEMDGRAKYRSATYGRDVEEVLYEEKVREDALRALGYVVVRWSWADLRHPERLHAKILRALELAARLA